MNRLMSLITNAIGQFTKYHNDNQLNFLENLYAKITRPNFLRA
jgi:hypothetical protein